MHILVQITTLVIIINGFAQACQFNCSVVDYAPKSLCTYYKQNSDWLPSGYVSAASCVCSATLANNPGFSLDASDSRYNAIWNEVLLLTESLTTAELVEVEMQKLQDKKAALMHKLSDSISSKDSMHLETDQMTSQDTAGCIRSYLLKGHALIGDDIKNELRARKNSSCTAGGYICSPGYNSWVLKNFVPIAYTLHMEAYKHCCCSGTPAPEYDWALVTFFGFAPCPVLTASVKQWGSCECGGWVESGYKYCGPILISNSNNCWIKNTAQLEPNSEHSFAGVICIYHIHITKAMDRIQIRLFNMATYPNPMTRFILDLHSSATYRDLRDEILRLTKYQSDWVTIHFKRSELCCLDETKLASLGMNSDNPVLLVLKKSQAYDDKLL